MRVSQSNDHLRVKVIAGTHVVLMALDMDEAARPGLRGFAIKRGVSGKPQTWLRGIKYFKDLVPNPNPADDYSSRDQPFQTFLWSDYQAFPGTTYDFTIIALYGDLHAMEERYMLTFSIKTEPEYEGTHGVWFNRGAIASHAFATKYHNKALTKEMANNVSDDGKLLDDETNWLSRGLAEACLKYINDTKPDEALRVCAYEFTYLPILKALKRALDRRVDLRIVYHDTKQNGDAIAEAELPESVNRGGKKTQILYKRTRPPIPHNKFIVKLTGGAPAQVWTGSTNFTDTGFLGQTNVGHLVTDAKTAKVYFDYWTELSQNPAHKEAMTDAIALTPNPPNAIPAGSIAEFFSPRKAENMLDWYAQRIADAGSLAMMTIPFNVAPTILAGLGKKSDAMRFVILEDPPTAEVTDAEKSNRGKLAFSNGAILGKTFVKYKTSFGGAKVTPIPNTDLDDWFIEEELARPSNNGHVFFVHAKVLVIDPLSDDPLVCSGSANFSKGSLITNDENMLLIRGDTRIADIYMTEIDRIFRHFYARDVINNRAAAGVHNEWLALDTTDAWIGPNFKDGTYKNNRRLLFFPVAGAAKPWSSKAATDPSPFEDEDARAEKARTDRNQKAKERRAGGAKKTKKPPKKAGKRASTARKAPAKRKSANKKKTKTKRLAPAKSKTKRKAPRKRTAAKARSKR
jgi:phosphatidylserine/phosphatidylglycerophosphate/cardiolipin synthase-like enzyme